VEITARGAEDAPLAPFCLDAAPVTTEAYKACSDEGDCKRAATENRWAGISVKDQAAYDPLCRERDPKAHAKEPMNCVDREMAAVFCKARGSRLPTEAEAAFVTHDIDGRPRPRSGSPTAGGAFSEWSEPGEGKREREREAASSDRSYAVGFRCARSL
jgi:Sulfatase-modifying factor enzyme 1